MSTPYAWHKVNRYYGFLAIYPGRKVPAGELTLHVMALPFEFGTVAWWEAPQGLFVRFTLVGQS